MSQYHLCARPGPKLHEHFLKIFSGGGLIMVGEGINDAPALAAATVGIVLAQRASATAVAVADVLLLRDNISGVPFCIAKSRQTTSLVLLLTLSLIFSFLAIFCNIQNADYSRTYSSPRSNRMLPLHYVLYSWHLFHQYWVSFPFG